MRAARRSGVTQRESLEPQRVWLYWPPFASDTLSTVIFDNRSRVLLSPTPRSLRNSSHRVTLFCKWQTFAR